MHFIASYENGAPRLFATRTRMVSLCSTPWLASMRASRRVLKTHMIYGLNSLSM